MGRAQRFFLGIKTDYIHVSCVKAWGAHTVAFLELAGVFQPEQMRLVGA